MEHAFFELSQPAIFQPAFVLASALLLDKLLGEPKRWHPIVGLGKVIRFTAERLYRDQRRAGVLAVGLLCLPWLLLLNVDFPWWLEAIVLYLAIGGRCLGEHGRMVADALQQQGLAAGREKVSWIVSRQTDSLSEPQVISATIESMLENGNDAVFGALFWYLIGGLPAVVIYRISNTLDACWGYRNAKWARFGWAAAKLDDLLNYLPARLTVFTYAIQGQAIQGHGRQALRCAWQQGRLCASPNGGPVMAAGAGALNIVIGGPAQYDGYRADKPWLGAGEIASVQDIDKAIHLVERGGWLWLAVVSLITVITMGLMA